MWVGALRKLRDAARRGEDLSRIDELKVEVDFRDRNRPQTRQHSGNFLRGHETKKREVDPVLHRKLIEDVDVLKKTFAEIKKLSASDALKTHPEFLSISQILSELEERIEELTLEVKHTRNTKIAENDVWRTRIDMEALREKIRVLIKQQKSASKRRWSVF